MTQPDSAAVAARGAAGDDSGLDGSRGILGVTRGELLVALWLSLACAVTAALFAVPAGAVYFFGEDLGLASLGEGVDRKYAFRDTVRMQRREPYTVEFDWSTTTARWGIILACTWQTIHLLFCFPVCYVAYLGASLNVGCAVLGSAVLAIMVSSAGFVVSEKQAFRTYCGSLGFALLIVALKLICRRNSAIPRHALKQALAFMLANVCVANVIPDETVGDFHLHSLRARAHLNTDLTLPVHRTWLASCKRLFCSTYTRRRAGASWSLRRTT